MMQVTRRVGAALAIGIGAITLFAIANGQGPDLNAECVSNTEKLVKGLQMYLDDWDGTFPTMKTPAQFQAAITPFVSSSALFTCPATGFPYKPDASLSGSRLVAIDTDYTTVALRDAVPHADGKSTVMYLDGHVDRGGVDADPNRDCVRNARQVVSGLLMYVQDYDDVCPPMNNSQQFEQFIAPYLHGSRLFHCPATHLLYKPNPQLSYVPLKSISDWGTTAAFQDAQPHADGQSTVAFLDQHVERGGVDQADPDVECANRISTLIAGMFNYAQPNNQQLPPMQNISVFKQAVFPYLSSFPTSRVFVCPYTEEPYKLNAKLSGVALNTIPDLSKAAAIKDPLPHADGKYTVGYLDGYIERGGVDQADPNQECESNMCKLLSAFHQYINDHNNTFPPMQTYTQFKQALFPYVRSSRTFLCPYTHLPYTLNTSLSGQPDTWMIDPYTTVVLRDPRAHADGRFTVGYLDGHVEPFRDYYYDWWW